MSAGSPDAGRLEIIAIGSGKGGTGKTLTAACLGYTLIRAGHRVLLVDFDRATGGLSLFILGPDGVDEIRSIPETYQVSAILDRGGAAPTRGFRVVRSLVDTATGDSDHGVEYDLLISHGGVYGDVEDLTDHAAERVMPSQDFLRSVDRLFSELRREGHYDYVIADTRGGFGIESTGVCALADSYIVVTEPDYTSFYQDRNLVRLVDRAAKEAGRTAILRAIIVNKATEGPGSQEQHFRSALERELPVRFTDTHAVPLDLDAIQAYKSQEMPYVAVPASDYSLASLSAFVRILHVVTGGWSQDHIDRLASLQQSVSEAVAARKRDEESAQALSAAREAAFNELTREVETLRERLANLETLRREETELYQQTFRREEALTQLLGRMGTDPGAGDPGATSETRVLPSPVAAGASWSADPSSTGQGEAVAASPSGRAASPASTGPARSLRRWLVPGAAVAVLVATGWYTLSRSRSSSDQESLIQAAFETANPGPLRISAISDLGAAGFTDFQGVVLDGVVLDGVDLSHRSFRRGSLVGASLRGANLRGSVLAEADLTGADLSSAVLDSADLRGAVLREARLGGAKLASARLEGASFTPSVLDFAGVTVWHGAADDGGRAAELAGALSGAGLTEGPPETTTAPVSTTSGGESEVIYQPVAGARERALLLADLLSAMNGSTEFTVRAAPDSMHVPTELTVRIGGRAASTTREADASRR